MKKIHKTFFSNLAKLKYTITINNNFLLPYEIGLIILLVKSI
jgi:hypothetical protein